MIPRRRPIPTCPSCQQMLEVPDDRSRGHHKKYSKSTQPRLLDCGHTVCESCVRLMCRSQSICCCLCQVETPVPDGGEDSYKKVPTDVYVLGVITSAYTPLPDKFVPQFVPAGASKQQPHVPGKHSAQHDKFCQMCEECNNQSSVWKCVQCSSNLCNSCFQTLHNSKVLSRHEAVPFFQDSGSRISHKCKIHNAELDFYCQDDDLIVCSHCIIVGEHQKHNCIPLKDKNEEYLGELGEAMGSIQKVVKRLKKAEKVVANATRPNLKRTHVIDEIHAAFQHLHGILQIREKILVNKAEELCQIHNSPVDTLKIEIGDTVKFANMLLTDAQDALNSPQSFNISALLQKMNQVVNESPSYLVDVGQADTAENLAFEVDLNLVRNLYRIGEVIGNTHVRYKLCSEKQRPATANLDSEETENSDDDESSVTSDMTTSTKLSYESLERKLSVNTSRDDVRRDTKIHRVKNEMVTVTHIQSPALFYAQRSGVTHQLTAMSNEINLWCNSGAAGIVTDVEPDEFVFAKYTADNKWYRAQVQSIVSSSADDREPNDEMTVNVLYIDYGNNEILPVARLRPMAEKFLERYEISLMKCAFHNISPIANDWTKEAIMLFHQFAMGQILHLVVFEEFGGVLHVDLRRAALLKDIKNDSPASAREALVFLDHASFISREAKMALARRQCQQSYLPEVKTKVYKMMKVSACYVKSPHQFYVQQIGENCKYLGQLMFDMQKMYSDVKDNSQWSLFCPRLGMPCVALYPHDNQWYRARIDSEPVKDMIKVTYVDYGNAELLPWTSVRKMADKFLKLPIQAMNCSLVDVAPPDGSDSWSEESEQLFVEIINNKHLEMNVNDETELGFSVILYDSRDDRHICVNALLVERAAAISTGPNSTIVNFLKGESKSSKKTAAKPAQQSPASRAEDARPVPKIIQKSPTPTKSVKRESGSVLDWNTPVYNLVKNSELPDMIEVTVSHVVSPALLYVQLCGPGEEQLIKLVLDMQKTYSKTPPSSSTAWQEEQHVAALYSADRQWYRGRIMAINENTVTVHFYDRGYTEEVDLQDLRKLQGKHHTRLAFAVPCMLTDIVPAGGTSSWTATACRYLVDCVDRYDTFFLAIKHWIEKKYMAVDLYAQAEEHSGALEPCFTKFVSITKELVENGMALPVRRKGSRSPTGDGPNAQTAPPTAETLSSPLIKYMEIKPCDLPLSDVGAAGEATSADSSRETLLDTTTGSAGDCSSQEVLEVPVKESSSSGDKPAAAAPAPLTGSPKKKKKRSRGSKGTKSAQKPAPVVHVVDESFVGDSDDDPFDDNLEDRYDCPEAVLSSNFAAAGSSSAGVVGLDDDDDETKAANGQVKLKPDTQQQQQQTVVWRKPKMPRETVFDATITYVDFDGCFYVHSDDAEPTLDLIKSTLLAKYENSAPECHDLYWYLDEACIAQYEIDQNWYRGQVKSITDKGVEVIFIDYGNAETVPHHKLRKKLSCTAFPRMSLKCMLHAIVPDGDACQDGNWAPNVLDYLHTETVDKKVVVTLKESPVAEPLQASIRMKQTGVALEDLLVSSQLARKVASPVKPQIQDVCIIDSQDEAATIPHYKRCPLPPAGEIFPVISIATEFPKKIWIQRNVLASPKTKYEKSVNKQAEELSQMNNALTKEAQGWKKPKSLGIGDAVCATYNNDWFRATLREITPKGPFVLFVDYGNSEVVAKKDVRALPEQYLKLPMQAVLCELHQVVPKNGQWSNAVYEQLEAVVQAQQNKLAVVRETGPPVKIDLLKQKDAESPLEHVYQPLIDEGIIMLIREKSAVL